jgi:hypothetical protein
MIATLSTSIETKFKAEKEKPAPRRSKRDEYCQSNQLTNKKPPNNGGFFVGVETSNGQ